MQLQYLCCFRVQVKETWPEELFELDNNFSAFFVNLNKVFYLKY